MPFLEPYYREPYFPRSPIFFADFWGHIKFALLFLFLFFVFIALAWNAQPWFELKIVPARPNAEESNSIEPNIQLPAELQRPQIRSPGKWIYHRVRRGETLSQIAAYYGVDVYELAILNRILNPDKIFPGQVLYIPRPTRMGTY